MRDDTNLHSDQQNKKAHCPILLPELDIIIWHLFSETSVSSEYVSGQMEIALRNHCGTCIFLVSLIRCRLDAHVPQQTRLGRCRFCLLTSLLPSSHPLGWSQWWYHPERESISCSGSCFQVVKALSGHQLGAPDSVRYKAWSSFMICWWDFPARWSFSIKGQIWITKTQKK